MLANTINNGLILYYFRFCLAVDFDHKTEGCELYDEQSEVVISTCSCTTDLCNGDSAGMRHGITDFFSKNRNEKTTQNETTEEETTTKEKIDKGKTKREMAKKEATVNSKANVRSVSVIIIFLFALVILIDKQI